MDFLWEKLLIIRKRAADPPMCHLPQVERPDPETYRPIKKSLNSKTQYGHAQIIQLHLNLGDIYQK